MRWVSPVRPMAAAAALPEPASPSAPVTAGIAAAAHLGCGTVIRELQRARAAVEMDWMLYESTGYQR